MGYIPLEGKLNKKSLLLLKVINQNGFESISRIIRILSYNFGIPQSTLWYQAKKLEKMGLIKILKGKRCIITQKGKKILAILSL